MKTIKVQNSETDIYIECPTEGCMMAEGLGVDEARHHLSVLPIIHWEDDEEGKNEVSHHECVSCKTKFKVEWDYTINEDFDDDESI